MKILIVKTSSLGDILQTLPVIHAIKGWDPACTIDWVVEKSFCELLDAHPHISEVIPLEVRKWKRSPYAHRKELGFAIKALRKKKYDFVFDLQGNVKSGLITALTKGKEKVGYSFRSAAEWPAPLFTTRRYHVDPRLPITEQYFSVVQRHLKVGEVASSAVTLNISDKERRWLEEQVAGKEGPLFMVCMGSNWENKTLSLETWKQLLEKFSGFFFFVWGTEKEQQRVESLHAHFKGSSTVLPRMSLPVWQRLMGRMDRVFTVDSGALHLAATTTTPSLSLFGPSKGSVYKPEGERHVAFQGECPYGQTFDKRCPKLRTCSTGACLKEVSAQDILAKTNGS